MAQARSNLERPFSRRKIIKMAGLALAAIVGPSRLAQAAKFHEASELVRDFERFGFTVVLCKSDRGNGIFIGSKDGFRNEPGGLCARYNSCDRKALAAYLESSGRFQENYRMFGPTKMKGANNG